MPKTYITQEQRQQAKMSAWIYGQMKIQHITQAELAEKMGITQQGLSKKIRNHTFSYSDVLLFVKVFEPDQKELAMLLGQE